MRTERVHGLGAIGLLLAAAILAWYGQPTPEEKWHFMAGELEPRLIERQVQVEPAELVELMYNDYIDLRLIDVRSEHDWNLFHLWGAVRVPLAELPAHLDSVRNLPQNGVVVLISNDERDATQAWKLLMAAASRPNAYILAGGINRWLDEFAPRNPDARPANSGQLDETLRYPLKWAMGSRNPASLPDPHDVEAHGFTKRVRLQTRVVRKGGCG